MLAMRWLWKGLFFSLFFVALNLLIAPVVFSATDDVPRITIQELKAKMDQGEDMVILDVRLGSEYEGSKIKIKGSIRIPVLQLEDNRYKELPRDKDIVAYCT
jgi:3-mercaptopyruvate sulfurtransferase SseA